MEKEMKKELKKIKRKAMVANILIVVLLTIILFSLSHIQNYDNSKQEEYPTGGLSLSIFESQNNEYEPNEELLLLYYLYNGHYVYDMYDVQAAKVGNSSFYKVSPTITVGITSVGSEFTQEPMNVLEDDLLAGFEISSVSIVSSEDGYRNGWSAAYRVFDAVKHNDAVRCVAFIAKIEEGYFIISAFSSEETYESINNECIKIYDTVRVSEEWLENNAIETTEPFVTEETTFAGLNNQQ